MSNPTALSSSYKVLRSRIGDSWDVEIIAPDGELRLKPGFKSEAEAQSWAVAESGKRI